MSKLIWVLVLTVFLGLWAPGELRADSFYPNAGVDTTDEAETVPYHHGQVLLNSELDRPIAQPFYQMTTLAFKYGLSPRLDFGLQLPYTDYWNSSPYVSGFNDLQGGFKYLWTPNLEENRLLVSTIFSLKPDTADYKDDLGNGATDCALELVVTHRLGRWAEHFNYGYNFLGTSPDTPRPNHPYYKFKIDRECSQAFSLSAEIYGEDNADNDFNENTLQSTVKFTYALSSNLSLDYGMAWGLNGRTPLRRNLFGFTWNF